MRSGGNSSATALTLAERRKTRACVFFRNTCLGLDEPTNRWCSRLEKFNPDPCRRAEFAEFAEFGTLAPPLQVGTTPDRTPDTAAGHTSRI